MKTMMKISAPLVAIAALSLLVPACSTNVQGDDASPVFLTVEFTLIPGNKNVADLTPLSLPTTAVNSVVKDPTAGTGPFLDVRMDDYVVTWKRIDGGTKAPGPETFGGQVLVPAGGTSTLSNYPFMSVSALQLSPLDQLFPFNGGLDRETGRFEIRCLATVTFRGHTLGGQPAQGSGNFDMTFLYVAPQGRAR